MVIKYEDFCILQLYNDADRLECKIASQLRRWAALHLERRSSAAMVGDESYSYNL